MDMSDPSSTSRMERLILDYYTIVRDTGCSVILEARQNLAVSHVLNAIRSQSLQARIWDNRQFGQYKLRKNFRGFSKHAMEVAKAFEMIDICPGKRHTRLNLSLISPIVPEEEDDHIDLPKPLETNPDTKKKKKRTPPPCPMSAYKKTV